MEIVHLAIWVNNLEGMKAFYSNYFDGIAGENYSNPLKNFESSFVRFKTGTSIELMRKTNQQLPSPYEELTIGFHHFAFSVGSREKVDQLTLLLEKDGYTILGQPRVTGDGYYESVIADPEGNRVEIVETS
jgi:lactoylglutathione lyase